MVAVDSGHNNFHSIDRNFGPFADLLRNDGFQVVDSKSPFTKDSLSPFKILVIANALPGAPAKGVHEIHDLAVSSVYQSVRLVTAVVAKVADVALEIAEKP